MQEVRATYEDLLRALESVGLRVASRPGRSKKAKEVWVFVGAGRTKVDELVKREA